MDFETEKRVALAAVTKAVNACTGIRTQSGFPEPLRKQDNSPVTLADFFVQALINMDLVSAFPDIPVVAEESSSMLSGSIGTEFVKKLGRLIPEKNTSQILRLIDRGTHEPEKEEKFWTLDPIDGTRGFLAGRQYAIALALIADGEVVLGVLGCPELAFGKSASECGNKGCVFSAEKGCGAYGSRLYDNSRTRISVSRTRDASRASVCESAEARPQSYELSGRVANALGMTTESVKMDSQSKYAVLARGDVSIYLRFPPKEDYKENIWDHAAGSIIVTEAGGTVTDCFGRSLDFSCGKNLEKNSGILATNGAIHEEVLQAVRNCIPASAAYSPGDGADLHLQPAGPRA